MKQGAIIAEFAPCFRGSLVKACRYTIRNVRFGLGEGHEEQFLAVHQTQDVDLTLYVTGASSNIHSLLGHSLENEGRLK